MGKMTLILNEGIVINHEVVDGYEGWLAYSEDSKWHAVLEAVEAELVSKDEHGNGRTYWLDEEQIVFESE